MRAKKIVSDVKGLLNSSSLNISNCGSSYFVVMVKLSHPLIGPPNYPEEMMENLFSLFQSSLGFTLRLLAPIPMAGVPSSSRRLSKIISFFQLTREWQLNYSQKSWENATWERKIQYEVVQVSPLLFLTTVTMQKINCYPL